MADLSITLAQINLTVGALDANVEKICKTWEKAGDADLVVFPELAVSGYPAEDLVTKPSFLDAVEKSVRTLKKFSKTQKSAALVGCPVRRRGKIFNAALLIENGKILATVAKHRLPDYGVFDETRVFSSAPLPKPVSFRGKNLGIMICEDMWYADVAARLKSRGADILIVPNASPWHMRKNATRLAVARRRVQETGLPLVYLNLVGGQDELVFDGASFAMDAQGNVTFTMPAFEESVQMLSKQPKNILPPDDGNIDDVYKALTLSLRDYIGKNHFPGVLLGLSGGIDSALAAAIATDALGAENVHAVMLPSRYTSRESIEDAEALARNLKIKLDTISIEPTVTALENALQPHVSKNSSVTWENIQARARGVILMGLSNASGKMVLTTGNKSELAVGYATLYGDMCGGFNVLKDVYKTQVYELAKWRNRDHVIPGRIFTKAPTAELRPGQTDQDSLPPYDMLDAILLGLIEQDLGVKDLMAQGFERATVTRVAKMLAAAEYKRRQSAPGPKITTRNLGRDRRYPITNAYKD